MFQIPWWTKGLKGGYYSRVLNKQTGRILENEKWIIAFEKLFLFWVPMNIQKDRKAKLESAYSFMLKYSKITV